MTPFLAIHAKGEKIFAQSKRTAPPPNFNFKIGDFQLVNFKLVSSCFQRILSFGILLCSKGGESSISKMIYQNPLEH
jgi:hypothetical protein